MGHDKSEIAGSIHWRQSANARWAVDRVEPIRRESANAWRRTTAEDAAKLLAVIELTQSKDEEPDENETSKLANLMLEHFGPSQLERLASCIDEERLRYEA